MVRGACRFGLPHASASGLLTGVYENVGMGVRIRSERVYENDRNPQPYPDRPWTAQKALRILNDLSNADKHKMVHLVGLELTGQEVEVRPGAQVILTGREKVLHDRAEIMRIIPETPTHEVQMRKAPVLGPVVSVGEGVPSGLSFLDMWANVNQLRSCRLLERPHVRSVERVTGVD